MVTTFHQTIILRYPANFYRFEAYYTIIGFKESGIYDGDSTKIVQVVFHKEAHVFLAIW